MSNAEEKKELLRFCAYLRKHPDLFKQANLQALMQEHEEKKSDCKAEPIGSVQQCVPAESCAPAESSLNSPAAKPAKKRISKPRAPRKVKSKKDISNEVPIELKKEDSLNSNGIALKPDVVQEEKQQQ